MSFLSPSSPDHHEMEHMVSPVSLGEVFMASSSDRARDSVPEQYRMRFDQLRSGILAFCQEFHIPNEALKSTDIFGNALSSHIPRIPLKEIERVSLLFRRLEHLLVHKELWKDEEALREAERRYHLKEQYAAQVRFFKEIGILNEHNAILGIDGKEYPIPALAQIAERLCDPERREFFETKQDQEFTKLLLVPFGMSLDALWDIFEQFLLTYQTTQHPKFPFDDHIPLNKMDDYIDADFRETSLVYYPKIFREEHQGQTKREILEEQEQNADAVSGWRIHLFQPSNIQDLDRDSPKGIAPIPRQGKGKTHEKEFLRKDLEANKTPGSYLSILEETKDDSGSPYFGESGLTPEDWMMAFMIHLTETGQPLDDFENRTDSITYLIGVFYPSSTIVPCAYWYRQNQQVSFDQNNPIASNEEVGVRTSVIV